MPDFPVFPGNCPRNVSKDAKYGIRHDKEKGPVVALLFWRDEDELWRMTTEDHPGLVEMVNDVKTTYGGKPNGPFYVNEYKQVIVPVGDASVYYLAGTYEEPLRFEFEGATISGEPVGPDGQRLLPGDRWTGPHAGIPYVLAADGRDVYYRTYPRPNVEKRVRLSARRGKAVAEQIARMLTVYKGAGGGRFYVNEFGSVFSPVTEGDSMEYVYFGQIDLGSWFPDPTLAEAAAAVV